MSIALIVLVYIAPIMLVLAIAGALFSLLQKHSKKIETGMVGAVGYGISGYLWGGFLFPVVAILFIGKSWIFTGFLDIFFIPLFYAAFTLLANVWGVFLTNQKQKSLYRSSAVGLGFGLANALIKTVLPLYLEFQKSVSNGAEDIVINFNINDQIIVESITNGIVLAMAIVFYSYIAMLIGKQMNEKNWKLMIFIGLPSYIVIQMVSLVIKRFIPNIVAPYANIVIMILIGTYCFQLLKKSILTKT